ncbi:hypothetical protein MKW94_004229 [Papaver nudicaule]|uniref:Phytocyanin domain-containing protein n=1 Tax=Papaver nudicaule TaxID=74823 RepID=A0AA42B2W0_PAPNU|nr:hypothetical protein [Papaver nudicaule]
MGFNTKFLLSLVLLVVVPLVADAFAVWNVGNSAGWSVGDSLRFIYDPNTTDVKEVTSSDFKSCDATFAVDTFNTGNDTIPLTEVGDRFFISSNRRDCKHGQRVHIIVSNSSLVIIGPNHDNNGYVNIPKPQSTSTGGEAMTPTMSPTSTEAGGEAKTMSPSATTIVPPKSPTSSASEFSRNIGFVGVVALLVPLLGFVY